MMIRNLSEEETSYIYNTYLVKDFPASEVKSLKSILEGIKNGKYETFCYDDGGMLAYAFFIKSSVSNTWLLDYLAVVDGNRSSGIGSKFLQELKQMVVDKGGHLILEVENPAYEPEGAHRDYMIKRIGFYEKNGLTLSAVSCTFYGNEYRIFYAGEEISPKESAPKEISPKESAPKEISPKESAPNECERKECASKCEFGENLSKECRNARIISDEAVQAEVEIIYNDFFGVEFIQKHCKFHPFCE